MRKISTHSIVGDHDGADSRSHALCKGPQVQLVHSAIVKVRGDTRLDQVVHAIHLLLVRDQVFDGCNHAYALDSFDRQSSAEGLKDRIRAKALPVCNDTLAIHFERNMLYALLPPLGFRPKGPTLGPRWMLAPLPRNSSPMATPRRRIRSLSHVAPTVICCQG